MASILFILIATIALAALRSRVAVSFITTNVVPTRILQRPTFHGPNEKIWLNHANEHYSIYTDLIEPRRLMQESLTVFSTSLFPENDRIRPTLGNGHIATVVYTDTIYMNGLYNGLRVFSHRARIPSTCAIEVVSTTTRITKSSYSLDIEKGMFIEVRSGPGFKIELKRYAHRSINQLMITEMTVDNCCLDDFKVDLEMNYGNDSEDITLRSDIESGVRHTYGKTKVLEDGSVGGLQVYMISTDLPPNGTVVVKKGQKSSYLFLTSIDTEKGPALNAFNKGVSEYFNDALEDQHIKAWRNIWANGRVDIIGDPETAKVTYAAYYYIISSIPITNDSDLSFVGLSPGDLAHGSYYKDYQGHVFWDQETWMYPPIQVLHSDFGKTLLKSRIRTLDSAKQLAKQKGYKGAMYPWESAYTGFETSPSDETADYEHHITGDISQAFYFYLTMTNDTDFMTAGRGAEVISSIADFWESRVTLDKDTGLYHINGVMPPDEYHWPVNDSAYTNYVAKISLEAPYKILSTQPKNSYQNIADNLFIPFNNTGQWHPEYDSYTEDVIVKQADVILLGYPLMMNLSKEVRRNDLLQYERVTPGGPAMTWGMFAIGWLELNQLDKANALFARQFDNVREPFYTWSENAHGPGAHNFITGMGGYLQSVLFGYGGIRVYDDKLTINGALPLTATYMKIIGIDYLGGSLNLRFSKSSLYITLTKKAMTTLKCEDESTGYSIPLSLGIPLTYKLSTTISISPA
ncbi:protein-glucosylgalactosylhydroxylysine glucosidase-like [Mytilus galloprovincialis]|uniref:protein-glucosylgalactosylhydroxylysine glucosidase-like n=1 Tax=Mytilus galloprovincialis TaxID=29158 RepID=UPI003F7C416D